MGMAVDLAHMPCDKMSDEDVRHIRLSFQLANAKMHYHTKVAYRILQHLFSSAIAAADPMRVVPPALPPRPSGMVTVLGAGKAAAAMAKAVEEAWGPPLRGMVVVPDGYGLPLVHVEVMTAAHPVPDERGIAAAKRMMALATSLGPKDFLLVLLSGGGSALLPLPVPGLSLQDKQAITRALLASGADIHAINAVRRHLSLIKGGGLLEAAQPAKVLTLAISDVVGNDPLAIASGPTVPDDTPARAALEICAQHDVPLPPAVYQLLQRKAENVNERDTPGPSPVRNEVQNATSALSSEGYRIIATPERALSAASAEARRLGLAVMNLGAHITGEAAEIAQRHALLAGMVAGRHHVLKPPAVILSGGELTVTLGNDPGEGGPNAEYALALSLNLRSHRAQTRIHALAADTDGHDGPGNVAGAYIAPDTLLKATQAGINPHAALRRHDSHAVFKASGGLFRSGPTFTNVNDFRAIFVT